jgi:glycerol-3-phosphate dehydrogenase (NAD(P)+)
MRVTVVGGGSWGTTLASLVAGRSEAVVWAREPEVVEAVRERHENPVFLPGVPLSPELRATTDLGAALEGAEVVVMAVPSPFFRAVLTDAAPAIARGVPVVSVVKGLEQGSRRRMTEVVAETLGDEHPVGVLSGPNLAREVVAGQPSATVIALPEGGWSERLQQLFMGPTFRVYSSTDVVGCEVAGAVKNVIAIAAGIAHGLGFGENTKAALVTRGLAELTRLGVALGGQPLTFLGLAGNGDLIATCSSPQSRNRTVGAALAAGRSLDEVQAEMRMVAEGVRTAPVVLAVAAEHGVEMPITGQVEAVLHRGADPRDAVGALMGRGAKAELDGLA